jgi:hypothetical protein
VEPPCNKDLLPPDVPVQTCGLGLDRASAPPSLDLARLADQLHAVASKPKTGDAATAFDIDQSQTDASTRSGVVVVLKLTGGRPGTWQSTRRERNCVQ